MLLKIPGGEKFGIWIKNEFRIKTITLDTPIVRDEVFLLDLFLCYNM